MISFGEIASGIYGAWRLALRDPSGLSYFDIPLRGFWRSFWAAVIGAPFYALALMLNNAANPGLTTDLRFVLIHLIAYCLMWTAYPLAMTWVARLLDRERHSIRFIVARNWTSVPQMVLTLLPHLGLFGLHGETVTLLTLMVVAVIVVYQWYVARTAMDVDGLQATALVILEFAINLMIVSAAGLMIPDAPASAPPGPDRIYSN